MKYKSILKNHSRTKKTLSEKKNFIFHTHENISFQKRKKQKFFIKFGGINHFSGYVKKISIPIFLLILGVSFFFIFYFFKIEEINIERNDSISDVNRAYESVDTFRGKPIFFTDTEKIIEKIMGQQENLKNVQISANFPKSLNIYLESFSIAFLYQKYLILENGYILETQGAKYKDIPKIEIYGYSIPENPKERYLKAEEIKKISYILEEIPKHIPKLLLQNVIYFPEEKEVIMRESGNQYIIFNLFDDTQNQIENLKIFFTEKDISLEKYIYIDVRIPKKVFVCSEEKEYQCKKNLKYIYGDEIIDLLEGDVSLPQPSNLPEQNLESKVDLPSDR